MELSEIRKLEKVVDRLAASGPSGVSPPHCWFCGKINAWFLCDCRDASDAREGKRAKPRVVERDGHMLIILDPKVMAREHNQKRKRYVPANKPAVDTPEPANSTVQAAPSANETAANTVSANSAVVAHANSDRKSYMRELMRKRRANKITKE